MSEHTTTSNERIDVERHDEDATEPKIIPVSQPATSNKERVMSNKSLLDSYVEAYKAGDLDAIMALYAEDAVQWMPDGIFEGRNTIRERLGRELAAFSDLDWGVVSFIEQGDAFADEWFFAGTHTGPLLLPDGSELPPTGKRVELQGMELCKVRNGELVVDNLYYDNLTVVAQLGLVPAGAAATPAA